MQSLPFPPQVLTIKLPSADIRLRACMQFTVVWITIIGLWADIITPEVSIYNGRTEGLLIREGSLLSRLNGVCTGHTWASTGVAPLGPFITAHVPSMARQLNAPFLAHLVFANEKAWRTAAYLGVFFCILQYRYLHIHTVKLLRWFHAESFRLLICIYTSSASVLSSVSFNLSVCQPACMRTSLYVIPCIFVWMLVWPFGNLVRLSACFLVCLPVIPYVSLWPYRHRLWGGLQTGRVLPIIEKRLWLHQLLPPLKVLPQIFWLLPKIFIIIDTVLVIVCSSCLSVSLSVCLSVVSNICFKQWHSFSQQSLLFTESSSCL